MKKIPHTRKEGGGRGEPDNKRPVREATQGGEDKNPSFQASLPRNCNLQGCSAPDIQSGTEQS